MPRTANLSTVIDAKVKNAVMLLCRRKGVKLQFLVEQALLEQLEDEIDLETIRSRHDEDTVPLEDILNGRDHNCAH